MAKFNTPSLKAGIHTVSIRSSHIPKSIPDWLWNTVTSRHFGQEIKSGRREYRTKVNPHHFYGELSTLEEFNGAMEKIRLGLDITDFEYTRIDFCLDDLTPGSYNKNFKVAKWMVMMAAMNKYKKSIYQSFDPMTLDMLTIRLKSEYFDIEFYDKAIESEGESPVQSRLELRSKRLSMTKREITDEIDLWTRRLSALPALEEEFLNACNDVLVDRWTTAEITSGKKRRLSDFIRDCNHRDLIFTEAQLADLCKRLGFKARYAKDLRRRYNLELYDISDLKAYIDTINMKLSEFATNRNQKPLSQ